MSRSGTWYLMKIAPPFDRVVIPRTRGRLSSTGLNRVGMLGTLGARSGELRTQPVVMVDDGDGLIVIGSNYGREKHPAWTYNLLKNPVCEVTYRGPKRTYQASLLNGADRAAAWTTAVDCYAGYERYRARCAPREIRLFRLRPA